MRKRFLFAIAFATFGFVAFAQSPTNTDDDGAPVPQSSRWNGEPTRVETDVPEQGLVIQGVDQEYRKTPWLRVYPASGGYYWNDVHAFDMNTLMAVGDGASVLQTDDPDAGWRLLERVSADGQPFGVVEFAPDGVTGIMAGDDVFHTRNAGQTWTKVKLDEPPKRPEFFHGALFQSVEYIDNSTGVACTPKELYYFTDGGATWTRVEDTLVGSMRNYEHVLFTDDTTVFAAVYDSLMYESYLYKSTNSGTDWVEAGPLGQMIMNIHAIQYNGLHLFLSIADGDGLSSGWLTTDQGANWRMVESPGFSWQDATPLSLGGTQAEPIVFSIGLNFELNYSSIIYNKPDSGMAWLPAPYDVDPLHLPNEASMFKFSDDGGGVVSTGQQIYRTTNGGMSWKFSAGPRHDFTALGVVTPSILYAGTMKQGLFRSEDAGASWTSAFGGVGGISNIHFHDELYGAVMADSGIYRTTNGGVNWTKVRDFSANDFFGQRVFCASQDHIFAAIYDWGFGESSFIRSSDGGATWYDHYFPMFGEVNDLDAADTNLVMVSAKYSSQIQYSTNGGVTWDTSYQSMHSGFAGVAVKDSSLMLAMTTDSTIFRSTDLGGTWTSNLFNIDFPYPNDLSLGDANFGTALNEYGKAITTSDGGLTWFNDPLPTVSEYYPKVEWKQSDSGMIGYVHGDYGIYASALYPLGLNEWVWTGTQDSNWFNPDNWSSGSPPSPRDEVVITDAQIPPVISGVSSVSIAGLDIQPGAMLTLSDGFNSFTLSNDLLLSGTLIVDPPNAPVIVIGGVMLYPEMLLKSSDLDEDVGFSPGFSTVVIKGDGGVARNFYALVVDSSADLESAGSIRVEGTMSLRNPRLVMRVEDTLALDNPDPTALQGGEVRGGAVRRTYEPGATTPYRFESDLTTVAFPDGNTPNHYTMQTLFINPDTLLYVGGDTENDEEAATKPAEPQWVIVEDAELDTAAQTYTIVNAPEDGTWTFGFTDGAPKPGPDEVAANRLMRRVYRGSSGRNNPK
ncbi:MAG: hypothetical protein GF419_00210, partial [Ignavibacteriales bacterium]|nr:hypothetical protein [Ignavibacteriales bacterium]